MPGAGAVGTLGGGEEAPEEEPEEEQPEEGKEATPEEDGGGFRDKFKSSYDKAKSGGKKAPKKAAGKAAKEGGKKLAEKGAEAAAQKGLAALGTAVAGPLGTAAGYIAGAFADKKKRNMILGGILAILILIALIFGYMCSVNNAAAYAGLYGGTSKTDTDLSNPEHVETIKNIEAYTKQNGQCGKKLEFADPEDLKLIKEGKIDYRVLKSIEMLAQKNDHIKISHVMHLMSVVPANTIETHSDVENEFVDNISAHKDGMAFDVVEINCVYEKCVCSKECGCNKIPVKVVWQDKGDVAGIARDAGLGQITELLGLPDGALDGNNPQEIFQSTGFSELEEKFRVAEGMFDNIDTLDDFVKAYGQAEIEKALRLPPGSLKDQNSLSGYASEVGRKKMEEALKLPRESLKGSSPSAVEKNTGQKSTENELNIPDGLLTTNPQEAYNYLKNLNLSSQEKQSIETKLGWPSETINALMTDLKQGDAAGVNSTLIEVGKNVLEQAIGLLQGELDQEGSAPFSTQEGEAKDNQNNLPDGTFTALVTALKNGQNINPSMINIGSKELDEAMALLPGSIKSIIGGNKTPDQALDQSEQYGSYSNTYIGGRLGISEQEARTLKAAILSGDQISPTAKNIGIKKIENYFILQQGSLKGLIEGTWTYEDFIKVNETNIWVKADALGIPRDAINQLFAGNISSAAEIYGQYQLAETFGINIDQLVALMESADIEALIQNEVIKAVAQVLGIDAHILGGILTGNISPEALISIGFSILFGGPLGGIFGGVFGGIFGSGCSTACYQPTARENIHKIIGQLLNMGKEDEELKVTQIITFRKADVSAYESLVDEIYGDPRPINYGLFQRDEMRGHIHVGY